MIYLNLMDFLTLISGGKDKRTLKDLMRIKHNLQNLIDEDLPIRFTFMVMKNGEDYLSRELFSQLDIMQTMGIVDFQKVGDETFVDYSSLRPYKGLLMENIKKIEGDKVASRLENLIEQSI